MAAFSGSHRYVLDYLADEVLAGQAKQVRGFLLETSVLERLSGELCDAVTGRTDGQTTLEQVERAGLFLVPLDEVRGWWRYHHLFADLLRARLQQEQPGRVTQLHRNAAAWYEEHGLADDAIGHAVAAGEMLWAARIIEQYFDMVYYIRGEAATIHRWLSMLPDEVVRSRPRLLLAQAIIAMTSGHFEVAEPLLDAVARAPHDWADEPFEPVGGAAASNLINVPALTTLVRSFAAQYYGDAEATAAFATQTLAEIKPGERLLSANAHVFLTVAEWLCGRLTEAERAIASSVTEWRETGQLTMTAWSYHSLVLIRRSQGRLDAAVRTYRQTLDIAAVSGTPPAPPAGPAYVGLAEVAYQRNDLDSALRQVTEGIALCRQFLYPAPLATGLVTLAWIRQAQGDPGGAREAMDEAGRAALGPGVTGLLNPVPTQRARLVLAQAMSPRPPAGHANAASMRTTSRATPRNRSIWCWPGCCSRKTAQARHSGYWSGCTRQRPPRAGRAASSRSSRQALALAVRGDQDAAVDALALMLACPQGYMRVFVD